MRGAEDRNIKREKKNMRKTRKSRPSRENNEILKDPLIIKLSWVICFLRKRMCEFR